MVTPSFRHQSSFEPALGTDQRTNGKRRFYRIIEHFEHFENARHARSQPYSHAQLIRFTYEYSLSEQSQDNLLRPFFSAMGLSIDGQEDIDFANLHQPFIDFADYLINNFFLPLKAIGRKTPQPSPASRSAIQEAQNGNAEDLAETRDRLSVLRGACLIRDRFRCVVSQAFDSTEFQIRFKKDGANARDEEGHVFDRTMPFACLEVAHIMPYSLIKTDENSNINPYKQAVLEILNMLDSDVIYLIAGADIDRPYNAITLTHDFHDYFGNFDVFFEPVSNQPHTYKIKSVFPPPLTYSLGLPVTRGLYLHPPGTIDAPSPRLLAVHRAIAHILHFSGAGSYIDHLFEDAEEYGVRADGSTELDRLVILGLGEWNQNSVY